MYRGVPVENMISSQEKKNHSFLGSDFVFVLVIRIIKRYKNTAAL
jgi:hypothetical protein